MNFFKLFTLTLFAFYITSCTARLLVSNHFNRATHLTNEPVSSNIDTKCDIWTNKNACSNLDTFTGFKYVNVELNGTQFIVSWQPIDDIMYCYDVVLTPNSQFSQDFSGYINMVTTIVYSNFTYIARVGSNTNILPLRSSNEFIISTELICNNTCTKTKPLVMKIDNKNSKIEHDSVNLLIEKSKANDSCDYIRNMHPLREISIGKIDDTQVPLSWKAWDNVDYCTSMNDAVGFEYNLFSNDNITTSMIFFDYGMAKFLIRRQDVTLNFCPVVSRRQVEIYAKVRCGGVCVETLHEIVNLKTGVLNFNYGNSLHKKLSSMIIICINFVLFYMSIY